MTRQVFASGGDEDADFDYSAVQMSFTLAFAPANGDEPSSNLWIHTPDDIAEGVNEFVAVPFVKTLINTPATSVSITAGICG